MVTVKSGAAGASMFGDTDRAGGVPDTLHAPVPDVGPVYLEGRLVLSLSFCGGEDIAGLGDQAEPIERYVIWDHESSRRFSGSALELRRYEREDEVVDESTGDVAWRGRIDTRAPIIMVPDLDDGGYEANREFDLRWKAV